MRVESPNSGAPASAGQARVARVNGGVALNRESDKLSVEELRQRACTELLRQAAMRDGLLDAADAAPIDGVFSEAASAAIEGWLERELHLPEPSEEAWRRHAAHPARYRTGEQVLVRHILFAVTPGTDVVALRHRAEARLLEVRCHDNGGPEKFGQAARDFSNCPSGEHGGELGWLKPEDCACWRGRP